LSHIMLSHIMLSGPMMSRRRMPMASSWKLKTTLRRKKEVAREYAVPRLREGGPLNRPVERPAHRLCHPLYPD
jgi:hypothetical protein